MKCLQMEGVIVVKKGFLLLALIGLATGLFLLIQQEQRIDSLEDRGVTVFQSERVFHGFNLYNTRTDANIYLIDMKGRVAKHWFVEPASDWGVHYSKLDPEGNLYVVKQNLRLLKLSWDGEVLWNIPLGAHHDLDFDERGNLYSFDLGPRDIQLKAKKFTAYLDRISRVSPEGKRERLFHLYDALKDDVLEDDFLQAAFESFQKDPKNNIPDLFHANGISLMKRDVQGFCKKGDLMFSLRDLNQVVVYRPTEKKVVWRWGKDELDGQHFPVLMNDNTLLVFDNGRKRGEYSRVLKVNPISRQIVWEYKGTEPDAFHTKTIGGAFPLPNGNILVTEGRKGRVFELTPSKEIVWQFEHTRLPKYAELSKKQRKKLRAKEHYIFRMERYTPGYFQEEIAEQLQ
jgi:hypothetical protein